MASGVLNSGLLDTPAPITLNPVENRCTIAQNYSYRIGNVLYLICTGQASVSMDNVQALAIQDSPLTDPQGVIYSGTKGSSQWNATEVIYVFVREGQVTLRGLSSGEWFHIHLAIPIV